MPSQSGLLDLPRLAYNKPRHHRCESSSLTAFYVGFAGFISRPIEHRAGKAETPVRRLPAEPGRPEEDTSGDLLLQSEDTNSRMMDQQWSESGPAARRAAANQTPAAPRGARFVRTGNLVIGAAPAAIQQITQTWLQNLNQRCSAAPTQAAALGQSPALPMPRRSTVSLSR